MALRPPFLRHFFAQRKRPKETNKDKDKVIIVIQWQSDGAFDRCDWSHKKDEEGGNPLMRPEQGKGPMQIKKYASASVEWSALFMQGRACAGQMDAAPTEQSTRTNRTCESVSARERGDSVGVDGRKEWRMKGDKDDMTLCLWTRIKKKKKTTLRGPFVTMCQENIVEFGRSLLFSWCTERNTLHNVLSYQRTTLRTTHSSCQEHRKSLDKCDIASGLVQPRHVTGSSEWLVWIHVKWRLDSIMHLAPGKQENKMLSPWSALLNMSCLLTGCLALETPHVFLLAAVFCFVPEGEWVCV